MTPRPSLAELRARHLYDPPIGTFHIRNYIAQLRDGIYNKDRSSDRLTGYLEVCVWMGYATKEEVSFNQESYVLGAKHRVRSSHVGRPFLDYEGRVMRINGRLAQGHAPMELVESPMTLKDFCTDPRFTVWACEHLFAGGDVNSSTYMQQSTLRSKDEVDTYVNERYEREGYKPGPNTIATYGETPTTPDSSYRI